MRLYHGFISWGYTIQGDSFHRPVFNKLSSAFYIVSTCCLLQIVGPYFFEGPTVTGANYPEMLRTFASLQTRQIPNIELFQRDRAPPHWSRKVRAYLDLTFLGALD